MARTKTRTKHADASEHKILLRQMQALDLRIAGKSYRAIGQQLGCSHEMARLDVESELTRLAKERDGKAEEYRQLELERLNKITFALDHWIESGNVQAVNAYLRAMERRAKLLGLDAPDKQEISGANGEPLSIIVTYADH